MKLGLYAAALAAMALSFAPSAQAKTAKDQTSVVHHRQMDRSPARHGVKHRAVERSHRRAVSARVSPGPRRGYVQGIGEVLYGDAYNGPPNGGAYTLHPTGDPSIGYFPNLWDAQRRGDCVTDDGYGRFSPCADGP